MYRSLRETEKSSAGGKFDPSSSSSSSLPWKLVQSFRERTRLELTLRRDCRTSNFASAPRKPGTMARFCISGVRFHDRKGEKVDHPPFLLAAVPRFPRTKMNSAARAERACADCKRSSRANRSRLGLFASYRVKINVNFSVELISPPSINSTDSAVSLIPSFSHFTAFFVSTCFLALRLSLSVFSSVHV